MYQPQSGVPKGYLGANKTMRGVVNKIGDVYMAPKQTPLSDLPNVTRDKGISCVRFSQSKQSLLAATSWDHTVQVWSGPPTRADDAVATTRFEAAAPLLSCAWIGGSGETLVVGGCDCTAYVVDVETGAPTSVGSHSEPIIAVRPSESPDVVVTAAMDTDLHVQDTRAASRPVMSARLPARPYAMDSLGTHIVVGDSMKRMFMFDVRNLAIPVRTQPSPLRQQTTCITMYSDKSGFALGSTEGRCAVRFAGELLDAKASFAFKCHRQSPSKTAYPVNDIVWHPKFPHTFATCGGDGAFVFWDKDKKQRLQPYEHATLGVSMGRGITSGSFNSEGTLFAYAVSDDFTRPTPPILGTHSEEAVWIHTVKETDVLKR